MAERNFYEVLNIPENASLEEIKHHYHKLARLYHPDITKLKNTHDKFIEINFAYKTLKDPILRKAYDYGLRKKREKNGETAPIYDVKTSDNVSKPETEEKKKNPVKKTVSDKMKADFETFKKKAFENFSNSNFREALFNIESALSINDQSYDLLKMQGSIYLKQGNYDLAMEAFSKACKIEDNAEIRSLLSEAISGRSKSTQKNSSQKKGFFGLF